MTPKLLIIAVLGLATVLGHGQESPKKVSHREALEAATSQNQPDYPLTARQFNIQGVVELVAVVSTTGTVETVEISSGNPILAKAAIEALKGWKFKPFTEEGKPIKVSAPVTFHFKL